MPNLADPSEIQSLLGMHTDEKVEIHNGCKPNFSGSEAAAISYFPPLGIQEMANLHSILAGEGFHISENEFSSQENVIVNRGIRRMMEKADIDIAIDIGLGRYRTGGGGSRRLPIGRLGRITRRGGEDLIGDPIDPKRGHLVPENGKPVVERNITCAGSAAPEEMGGDTGAATENGDSLAGERGEWRKKDQRSGEKRGLDGRTTAVEVGDSREGGG